MAYESRKTTPKAVVNVTPGSVPGIVQARNIDEDAVTGLKIKDATIQAQDIAAQGIETYNLKDGCITTPKIGLQQILDEHLAVGAVGVNKIGAGAVGVTQLADNSITTAKIINGQVTQAKLGPDVGTSVLGVDSVDTLNIKNSAVTNAKLATDAVTATKIAAGAVGASELGTGAVLAAKIADGVITRVKFDTDAKVIAINPQIASYTLIATDEGKLIDMDNAGPISLTVPTNFSVPFAIGTTIAIRQAGAGLVTIAPFDGSVTINNPDGLAFIAQYGMAVLVKIAANIWTAFGALEP